jgi:hypothetical protein
MNLYSGTSPGKIEGWLATSLASDVAGVVGFEPTHDGARIRCLTTWLHPKKNQTKRLSDALVCYHYGNEKSRFPAITDMDSGSASPQY